MNGLEIYNEILENTHNLKGTWEVTADNYLNVTGNTNGSIVLFDKTVGALGDFILEWTAEQKGGSYIHSNLCPSLRYTPDDAGIEGGGDNYSLLVYLCNYGSNTGEFKFRTEGGTKSEVSVSGVSLNIDTVYTFKLERLNGIYRLYQDGVLINEAIDITKKKLYLGWYLWWGGSNASYQTNFILREYKLTKVDTKSYLDSIGLTSLWSKIKSLFATKTELASKANDSDVVHKNGDETIEGSKTFSNSFSVNSPSPRLKTKSTTYSSETSSSMTIGDIAFLNKNGGFSSWILDQLKDNLTKRLCFRVFPHTGGTYKGFVFNDNCALYPENTESSIGTSSNKWKTLNGINPGALSFPDNSKAVTIDTTNWDVAGVINTYTPPANGWIHIRVTEATELMIRWTGWKFGDRRVSATVTDLGITIPVVAGVTVDIVTVASGFKHCMFYPCFGNV